MPVLAPATPDELESILEMHHVMCVFAVELSKIDINAYNLDDDAKKRFLSARFWFDDYKKRVEIGVLTVIVSRLKALEPEISAATARLKQELQEMKDFLAVLLLIEKLVLLVGQVIVIGQAL